MLNPRDINRIFYHHPCTDGTMGYTVARNYYEAINKEVKYTPCGIGRLNLDGIKDENILFIDITTSKSNMDVLLKNGNKILILDHHKSAMLDLKDLPDTCKVFDMKKSGATLAWDYFYHGQEAPLVVRYVEDRDIWTKKLENNELFYSWFYKLPPTYEEYIKYFDNNLFSECIGLKSKDLDRCKASVCVQVDKYYTDEALTYAPTPQFVEIGGKYYFTSNVNSSILKSTVGSELFGRYPLIDFSCVTSNVLNGTHISLRSLPSACDVSEVAKVYGGGGHAEAAGIKSPHLISHMGKLIDDGITYPYLQDLYFDEVLQIVYLYSPINKTELAKYLLQKRRTGGKQNCIDIYEKLGKRTSIKEAMMAILWSYNPVADITCVIVKFLDDSSDLKNKLEIYELNFDYPLKFKGLYKHLDINMKKDLIIE